MSGLPASQSFYNCCSHFLHYCIFFRVKLKRGIIIQASTFSISLSFPPPSSSLKNLSVLFTLTGSIIGDALHCARAAAQSPSQFICAD